MTDANHIRQVYDRYTEAVTKGDVETIVGLYSDTATIEDPIGSDLRRGLEGVRGFYEGTAGTIIMKRTGPVRVAKNEAATPIVVLMGPEGEQRALDIVSTMVFDDDGKIQTMRAYWSFDAMRPAEAQDIEA